MGLGLNKSKIILGAMVAGLLLFSKGQIASAHFFQTDGAITTILHIDPNDNPVVGQPASLSVSVVDDTNKFQAANCDCNIAITRGNSVLLYEPLASIGSQPSIFQFKIPFIFSQPAVYHIVLAGNPIDGRGFQNFTTSYDFLVSQQQPDGIIQVAPPPRWQDIWPILLILLVMLGVVVAAVWDDKQSKIKHNH